MPKVSPTVAPPDVAVQVAALQRKSGSAWKHLGPKSWRDALLAVQASSASYGTPQPETGAAPVSSTALDSPTIQQRELPVSSPFPGDDSELEYADLWAEMKVGGACKRSVFVEESGTDTQCWVFSMTMGDGSPRVYCSFRGTSSAEDAKTDAKFLKRRGRQELEPLSSGWKNLSRSEIEGCAFHRGFYGQYCAVAAAVREELEKGLEALGGSCELVICGHSMGGALANICHFDLLASGFAQPERTQLITIGSGPAGNTWFANVHDRITKLDDDARRHLHIVNNNDPVPAAALGADDGSMLCCCVAAGDGDTYEHSGTMIWMGRTADIFRERSIGILGGIARLGRRLLAPCLGCCLEGSQLAVKDHMTNPHVCKLAEFISSTFDMPMRCLGSETTVARGGSVKALVWTGVGTEGFVFPELRSEQEGGFQPLQAKANFGICLSGGCFRATTLALGWVRILQREGILQQARYLSSNSGGSWFNSAFSYQERFSSETFLGDYIEPQELSRELAVKQATTEGCYAKAIADSNFMSDFVKNLVADWFSMDFFREKDQNKVRAWSEAVGKGFLDPYALGAFNAAYCLKGREASTQEQTDAPLVNTACRDPSMPFPILVGCIAAKGDERQFHCYEFTPLYSGCPAKIEDAAGKKFGGVLIEPFGANSKAPTAALPLPGPPALMDLDVEWPVPLVQTAGISSSYIAQMKADSSKEGMWEALGCPELHVWNGQDGKGEETPFADGGGVDNTAIHALLRRGTTKIVSCYANSPVWTEDEPPAADDFWDLSALFGAVPEGKGPKMASGVIDAAVFNKHVQVFETEKWAELVAAVNKCVADKVSVVVPMKLKVLQNKAQGVQGGYDADVVFVFNSLPVLGTTHCMRTSRKHSRIPMNSKAFQAFPQRS